VSTACQVAVGGLLVANVAVLQQRHFAEESCALA
jgi:hypothetical protein